MPRSGEGSEDLARHAGGDRRWNRGLCSSSAGQGAGSDAPDFRTLIERVFDLSLFD